MATFYKLKAGYVLTVTVNEGRAHVRASDAGSESVFTRSSAVVGPYRVDREFNIDGNVAVSMAADIVSAQTYQLTSAGAPVTAVRATLARNPAGDDNALTFTARVYGVEGNSITVAYVDPGGVTAALSVSVFRQAITVSLARAASAITSTAAEVKAAIEAHVEANQLVTVAINASDTGSADDGSGVVTALAAAAMTSGAGTGIGTAAIGCIGIDTTNGKLYVNGGTLAVPDWKLVTSA